MTLIAIKECATVEATLKRGYDLSEAMKLFFGKDAKVRIEIEDADQKHIDFIQDCGHNSPDDYSVKFGGEGFTVTVTSKDKPMPF